MPRAPSIDPHAETWLTGREACKLANCVASSLLRAAVVGYVRVKLIPGMPPRYHRADVERYAKDKPPAVPRPRPPGAKKPGPMPKARCQACDEDVKKPRGPKASEVVPEPRVTARGPGRKDKTLKGGSRHE